MSRGRAAGLGGAAGTAIVVVATAARYRRLARTLPGAGDAVLEIGCSTGEATRLLAAGEAGVVVAVDVAAEMVARTRAAVAAAAAPAGAAGASAGQRLTVVQLDGRDTAALRALIAAPDLIFVDVGGDARLDAVALQLRQCLLAFTPRTLVLRSAELAAVCAAVREVETPGPRRAGPRRGRARSVDPQAHALESLLDLSHSAGVQNRIFAARRLRRSAAPAARARLAELAADPDARVRRIATMDAVDAPGSGAPAGPRTGHRDGAEA